MPERATPGEHLLEVRDLRTHFFTEEGVVRAVDGVSFTIEAGKTLCVVGESGCGKSVMARSILNVVDPPGRVVGGNVIMRPEPGQEVDLAALPPNGKAMRAIRGKLVTMIFQEPMTALSPLYTIGNQIIEGIRLHQDVTAREARELAIRALASVGVPGPEKRIDAYSFELSGGLRQRAMIAMALVCGPRLLIADEPTTALDVTTQANLLDLLRQLQRDVGMAMLFITHDLGVVAEIADEVAVMYLGAIVERGSVHAIFKDPKHPYTRALLRSMPDLTTSRRGRLATIRGTVPHPLMRPVGCPFHDRCDFAISGLCDRVPPPTFVLKDGHEVSCHLYADAAEPSWPEVEIAPEAAQPARATVGDVGEPLIEVKDLKTHFPITKGLFNRVVGHVKALDGVSFTVHKGETLAVVGESGSGKTTLAHTIMRLHDPTSGEVRFHSADGEDVELSALSRKRLAPYYRELRMVFQDPNSSLDPRMPVIDVIGESLIVNKIARGPDLEARVRSLLERVGLDPDYIRRYPHAFSGGQRQRIGIARALAPDPALIVADEAVSALDVSVQAQILNLLADLQAELGLTYIFISHDLSVVSHVSDRVAVMYAGRIVELADTSRLFEAPLHPYTEALLSAVLRPNPDARDDPRRIRLEGDVADPADPPSGCPFHPRCRYRRPDCETRVPELREVAPGRFVACHYAEELELRGVTSSEEPAEGRGATP